MSDQFDVTLEDRELLHEVELTTNLIIAASEAAQALSQAEIDQILGVDPASSHPVPPTPPAQPSVAPTPPLIPPQSRRTGDL